jgi:hypothetical protein
MASLTQGVVADDTIATTSNVRTGGFGPLIQECESPQVFIECVNATVELSTIVLSCKPHGCLE